MERALLHRMPKCELHLHLDGSLRPATILELADQQGVALPVADEAALVAAVTPPSEGASLERYLAAFGITCSVLGTADALYRVTWELLEDLHAEHVTYAEIRYSPRVLPPGMDASRAVEAVGSSMRDAERSLGIVARQILCAMRHEPPEAGEGVARLAARSRAHGVVAFDLAGAEAPNPPEPHAAAFRIARAAGLAATVHAGEAAGPESIRGAIAALGARRIGHGTHLPEDPALTSLVREQGITIEACLTSNVQTGAVASLAAHPLRAWLDAGLRVAICTDNRLVSGVTVTDEFERACAHHALGPDDLRALTRNAFEAAFLPPEQREALRDDALGELDALLRAAPPAE